MSDKIKDEAHRIALNLAAVSKLAEELTAEAKQQMEGKPGAIGMVAIPLSVLGDLGKNANDTMRLFAAMGVIDRTRVAEESNAAYAGADRIVEALKQVSGPRGLVEGLMGAIKDQVAARQRRSEAEGEDGPCHCGMCELERSIEAGDMKVEDLPEPVRNLIQSALDARAEASGQTPSTAAPAGDRVLH